VIAACAHPSRSAPRRRSCVGCCVRGRLRAKYAITGNCCTDCCVHYWCDPCAICQEYEELTTRIIAANSATPPTPAANPIVVVMNAVNAVNANSATPPQA
jgi:hypothetical protein